LVQDIKGFQRSLNQTAIVVKGFKRFFQQALWKTTTTFLRSDSCTYPTNQPSQVNSCSWAILYKHEKCKHKKII